MCPEPSVTTARRSTACPAFRAWLQAPPVSRRPCVGEPLAPIPTPAPTGKPREALVPRMSRYQAAPPCPGPWDRAPARGAGPAGARGGATARACGRVGAMATVPTRPMNDGRVLPVLGLGTYRTD